MIVTCPSCETKFTIPDDKYQPGRKARCSSCGFVFPLPDLTEDVSRTASVSPVPVPPPDAPPAPAVTGISSNIAADLASLSPQTAHSTLYQAQAAFEQDEIQNENPDFDTAFNNAATGQPAPPASLDDIVPRETEKAAPLKRGRKKLFLIVGVVFVVALLGYGAAMVYSTLFAGPKTGDPAKVTDGTLVDTLGGRTETADAEQEAARQAAIRHLSLENVRQQTVTDNEKTGPMVVIEGTVVNNSDRFKDLILLEITLYDSEGNALILREQYAGITLSLLQLRTLSKAALENALGNQVVILTNNADIPPGGRVPFTTVFFDLPNAAYEFEVKLVDVQDSVPKK